MWGSHEPEVFGSILDCCILMCHVTGMGAMFVGAQKKLPKKERGKKEKKGENYINSDLIKSSLIENHYKNGWNSLVYYYRLLMSFDSLISHMENWDVCYLSLCNPFCCMMHMHLGSCLLTPFLDIVSIKHFQHLFSFLDVFAGSNTSPSFAIASCICFLPDSAWWGINGILGPAMLAAIVEILSSSKVISGGSGIS